MWSCPYCWFRTEDDDEALAHEHFMLSGEIKDTEDE